MAKRRTPAKKKATAISAEDRHADMMVGMMQTYFEDVAPGRRAGEAWAKALTDEAPIGQISEMFGIDMWDEWFMQAEPSRFGLAADVYDWIFLPPDRTKEEDEAGITEDVADRAREFWTAQTGGVTGDPSPRFLYEFMVAACDAWEELHPTPPVDLGPPDFHDIHGRACWSLDGPAKPPPKAER